MSTSISNTFLVGRFADPPKSQKLLPGVNKRPKKRVGAKEQFRLYWKERFGAKHPRRIRNWEYFYSIINLMDDLKVPSKQFIFLP